MSVGSNSKTAVSVASAGDFGHFINAGNRFKVCILRKIDRIPDRVNLDRTASYFVHVYQVRNAKHENTKMYYSDQNRHWNRLTRIYAKVSKSRFRCCVTWRNEDRCLRPALFLDFVKEDRVAVILVSALFDTIKRVVSLPSWRQIRSRCDKIEKRHVRFPVGESLAPVKKN